MQSNYVIGEMEVAVQLINKDTVIPDDTLIVDYSSLNNTEMCDMYGITRYFLNRSVTEEGRALPLEMGSACHQFFAAVRLVQLWKQGLVQHFYHQGQRLFEDDWDHISSFVSGEDADDWKTDFCLEALYSADYEDDPTDRKRTIANMEASCLLYLDNWQWTYNVWVENEDDPECDVGIEMPVDMLMTFSKKGTNCITHPDGEVVCDDVVITVRYVGLLDGLHVDPMSSDLIAQENKTTSRITEDWKMAFTMSHQISGYNLYASLMLDKLVTKANLLGLAIPLPKTDPDTKGICKEMLQRDEDSHYRLFTWILDRVQRIKQYKETPADIPMCTHSCNRYFRACSFIPYCYSSREDREYMFENELVHTTWEPLDGEKR